MPLAGRGAARPGRRDSMPSDKSEKRDNGRKSAVQAASEAMRTHGLSYPGAHEDFPWDAHRALKVKGKTFVFMGMEPDELNFSVKLPQSKDIALMLPFATPTGYGLGKSGWVSATFDADSSPPVDMLLDWVDESYRAIAPKRLIAQIGTPGTPGTPGAPRAAATADAGASAAGPARAPARDSAKAAKASKAPKAAKAPRSEKAGTSAKKKAAKAAAPAAAPARKKAAKVKKVPRKA
jgi:predicted DNA-binding protein (MmcQ/YjbR family)